MPNNLWGRPQLNSWTRITSDRFVWTTLSLSLHFSLHRQTIGDPKIHDWHNFYFWLLHLIFIEGISSYVSRNFAVNGNSWSLTIWNNTWQLKARCIECVLFSINESTVKRMWRQGQLKILKSLSSVAYPPRHVLRAILLVSMRAFHVAGVAGIDWN